MGVIFATAPCVACQYTPRETLFYHGGKLGLFRGLATCHNCKEIVSISPDEAHIPEGFMQMFGGSEAYKEHLARFAARHASPRETNICPVCGSHHLLHHDVWDAFVSKQAIELACPCCLSGRVRLMATGLWD